MTNSLFFLAQAAGNAAAQPEQQGTGAFFFIQLIALGLIFYFLLIRPQSKRRQAQKTLMDSVEAGDKIITNSGIHGIVVSVKETIVVVRIADNVKIDLEKAAIGSVTKSPKA